MTLKIPYGLSNFQVVATQGYAYVDKTDYIAKLEDAGRHLVLLRPRRFGKSLLLSAMEYYYDINHRDNFDAIFGKLYIGQHPTPRTRLHRPDHDASGGHRLAGENAVPAERELVEHDIRLREQRRRREAARLVLGDWIAGAAAPFLDVTGIPARRRGDVVPGTVSADLHGGIGRREAAIWLTRMPIRVSE